MFLEQKYSIIDIIKKCIEGERKAQEMLYKQFSAKMLGVCLRYAKDRMEAEDMLQNGFIKGFQKMQTYKGEGSFDGWVRRIMVHSSIEYYRKHHKIMQLVDLDDAEDVPATTLGAAANLEANDLLALINELSVGYRLVFNLYAIEGYSHKEIADLVGISEGASKSQLSRARAILKERVLKIQEKRYENAG